MVLSIVNASAYSNFADAVNMAVGGILYVPTGTYPIRSTIALPSNIYIEGGVNSVLTPDYTNYASNWQGTAWMFLQLDKQNISLENITIDGGATARGDNHGGNTVFGFYFAQINKLNLSGVNLQNMHVGTGVYGCKDVIIDSCMVTNCGDDRDIGINDSYGDGIYVGKTVYQVGGQNIQCERVNISKTTVKSTDRQGRIAICFEGVKYGLIDSCYAQGYDREIHWEATDTEHCRMVNSTIVHKPSEMSNTYFWNGIYKTHTCLYTLGRGNAMRGNTFIGDGATGSWYNGYAVDNNAPLEIFKDNIGQGIMTWVPSGRTAPDSTNIKIS